MREMKDSGIEWIGEIPEEWKVVKMSKICNTITDYVASGSFASLAENVKYLDEPDYAMLVRTIDVSDKGYSSKPVYIDEHSYNFLSNSNLFGGEIILPNIGASVGDVYIIPILYKRMSLAPNSIMLRTNEIDKFVYYYFYSNAGRLSLLNIAQSTAQPKFNKTDFRQLKIPLPSKNEQQKISAFLDRKCTEIDSVISKTKATIEEYKKLKQSVITQAVTKGIVPNRPMKDSGIEWIGEIPQEWEIKKFKYIANNRNDKVTDNNGNNYFALENVVSWNGVLIHTENDYDINGAIICKKGDVVFGKLRPYLAKVFQVDFDRCCSSEFAVFYNFHGYSRYYYYVMLSKVFVDTVNISTYGVKMPRANIEFIRNMYIPIFNVTEQQEIANYLDEKCTAIDTLIEKKQQLLTEMESYKKAVIYEYVTGKKEVE